MTGTVQVRFWAKVNMNGPTPTHRPELGPCWEWTASRQSNGYGMISVGKKFAASDGLGQLQLAHRLSFRLAYGRWPEPFALHHCDNRGCVRPEHLFEGTTLDKRGDAWRAARGVAVAS